MSVSVTSVGGNYQKSLIALDCRSTSALKPKSEKMMSWNINSTFLSRNELMYCMMYNSIQNDCVKSAAHIVIVKQRYIINFNTRMKCLELNNVLLTRESLCHCLANFY